MRIAHVALWTLNLEDMRDFYVKYFNGTSNEKYTNQNKGFESFFISFKSDVTLEIMRRKDVSEKIEGEYIGICHLAFYVKDKAEVLNKTEQFRNDGFTIAGEPRLSGDGYFESVILDPDGNRIELLAEKLI